MANLDEIKTVLHDDWFNDYKLDAKARRYVGQFFDRQLKGQKLSAKVVGNHGTYTVSITVKKGKIESACSCYVGRGGG